MTLKQFYKPGEVCPRSGFWARLDEWGDDVLSEGGDALETDVAIGNRFPATDRPGMRYRFSRGPVHAEDESQPVPEPPRPDDEIPPYTPRPQCAEPGDG